MPRLHRLIPLALAPVLIAGCGGSSHPASSQSAANTTSAAATASPATTTSSASSSTRATTHTTSTSATSPTGAPASGGAGLPSGSNGGTRTKPAGGATPAHIPANFELTAAGRLNPATVSAPAFVAISVDVHSSAAAVESVTIETPTPVHLTVPPRGRALTSLPGLRAGSYAILVDGRRAGALIAGAEPGP